MDIQIKTSDEQHLLVTLNGELDALGCQLLRPTLEQIVESGEPANVSLDLEQVSFLDSSGIGAIVFLFKRLKASGRGLEVIKVNGQPRELMKLLRIGSAIPVKTREEPSLRENG